MVGCLPCIIQQEVIACVLVMQPLQMSKLALETLGRPPVAVARSQLHGSASRPPLAPPGGSSKMHNSSSASTAVQLSRILSTSPNTMRARVDGLLGELLMLVVLAQMLLADSVATISRNPLFYFPIRKQHIVSCMFPLLHSCMDTDSWLAWDGTAQRILAC